MLGVTLVSASGGLYRLVSLSLLEATRILLGGDLEVDSDQPLPPEALSWLNNNGDVSLVIEVNTMLVRIQSSEQRRQRWATNTHWYIPVRVACRLRRESIDIRRMHVRISHESVVTVGLVVGQDEHDIGRIFCG